MKIAFPKEGQLVYAVVRRYRGQHRKRVLILHEAQVGPKKSFMYGTGKTWTVGIEDFTQRR